MKTPIMENILCDPFLIANDVVNADMPSNTRPMPIMIEITVDESIGNAINSKPIIIDIIPATLLKSIICTSELK